MRDVVRIVVGPRGLARAVVHRELSTVVVVRERCWRAGWIRYGGELAAIIVGVLDGLQHPVDALGLVPVLPVQIRSHCSAR